MKTDLQTFDELFDEPLERIIEIIDNYVSALTNIKPDVVLRVEIEESSEGNIWMGFIEELKEWGKEDVIYGHIKIIPLFLNSDTPMRVKLFCSHPNYMTYWGGVRDSLLKHLILSDGNPPSSVDPWMLIPDHGYDRKLLEYWHDGYTGPEIARKLYISESSVYDRLRKLRNTYKKTIVPYHYEARNQE